MKTINENFTLSVLTISMRGALAIMLAMPLVSFAEDAANTEAEALKRPSNFVEIGAMNVSHDSAKFGEYNGLDDSGAYAVGNFDVRGGSAYDEGDGTMRWQAKGINLGTSSRSLNGRVSDQGLWDLNVNYDELRHNITDSYQTPFQGHMGGDTFRLPSEFGIINTTTPTNTTVNGGSRGLTANQKSFFHDEDVHTDRKNTSFSFGYNFDPQWNVQLDYNRLDQSGAKLISSATEAKPNGILIAAPGGAGTHNYAGQAVIVLMNPLDYQTDTVNLALNWTGDKGRLAASYAGSFFSDKNNSLSWQNPFASGTNLSPTGTNAGAAGFPVMTMSTAPDNQFHQFNLTGGYDFSPSTKLAGGLSYGRNTQDDSFLTNNVPINSGNVSSLNGKVNSYNANLKLTNQATKDLALSAELKYNERDNKTSVHHYQWFLVDGAGALEDDTTNSPESTKRYQAELAANYRINDSNNLRAVYNYDQIKRWCNGVGGNCTAVTNNYENTLGLEYRLKASDSIHLNAGYSYADRRASTTENYDSPMHSDVDADGTNVNGFVSQFWAARTEQVTKAGVTWQATDKLDLGLNGRYVYDDFTDNRLGVQSSDTWSLNLDATFNYSENGSVSAYGSIMKRWRDMTNAGTAVNVNNIPQATGLWSNRLTDDEDSIGINAKHKGLMGGKLNLAGDLSYIYGNSGYTTNLLYTPATACTGTPTANLACGSTPDITNKMLQLKLLGNYQVDKHSTVGVGYTYQRLHSNDYFFNGYQMGFTSNTLLPTNQQDQSYSVNLLTATYSYNF